MKYPIYYDYSGQKDSYNPYKVLVEVSEGEFYGMIDKITRSNRLRYWDKKERPWPVLDQRVAMSHLC